MDINRALRYLILLFSAAAMAAGGMIVIGWLVPRNPAFGVEFRVVSGAVIFLYGLYRFVVTWNRRPSP